MNKKGNIIENHKYLTDSIIRGDSIKSKEFTQKLLDEGVSAVEILNDSLMPGMDVVGNKFRVNEMYIPEVLIAAKAMHAAMDIIKFFSVICSDSLSMTSSIFCGFTAIIMASKSLIVLSIAYEELILYLCSNSFRLSWDISTRKIFEGE